MTKKLIILDRDGVINEMVIHEEHGTIDSPLNINEVVVLPKTIEALKRLQSAGFDFAIATNQPAAAKRKTTQQNLWDVHNRILSILESAKISVLHSEICFHKKEDLCLCRKPNPGMLESILLKYPQFKRDQTYMIGDGITDIQAGKTANLKTVFLGPKKCDACKIFEIKNLEPDFWLPNLGEFSRNF